MQDLLAFTVVGIVTGAIYAVAASGLVVTYTTSGVFNFAHGAIGMFMAFLYWYLRIREGWPAPIALIVVLFIAAPLLGALIERVLMRKLYNAPMGVSIVVTLALLVILLGAAQSIWNPTELRRMPGFFDGRSVKVFSVNVTYHQLIALAVAGLIAAGLRFLMFHTRTGVTMRAVVDNRDLASMNGVYPERVAQVSWAIGAGLAGVAGVLIAPQLNLNHVLLTFLVINGYAAAMLGKLKNLPLTFIGALSIGLGQSYIIGYGSSVRLGSFTLISAAQIVPTLFLLAILVCLPQVRLPAGRLISAAAPRVPSLKASLAWSGVFIGLMLVLSRMLSEFWLLNFGLALVTGIMALSLVLLSGFAGQISLMQWTFVGIGALVAGRMVGNGSIWGILLAGVITAAAGAVVALPALRLQALYLALATLAFALFGDWAFNQSWGFSQGGTLITPRLKLPGVAFKSEQSQLVLLAISFSLFAMLVLAIRRGPYGRRLAALRDSPVAASMLGMNLVAAKTTVFALSAGMAGMAGALFAGLRVSVSPGDFNSIGSLFLFLVATFGGLTTVVGALFAGFFLMVLPEIQKQLPIDNIQYFGIGIGAISLAGNPHGFGGSISLAGEQLRAAIAERRHRPARTRTVALEAGS